MAANDELPRGAVLTANPGANAQATVTFPATPGIAWVLTEADWNTYVNGETIAQQGLIQVNIGGSLAYTIGVFIVNAQSGWQASSGSWQGKIAGAPGKALEVYFSGGISGGSEQLEAQAYPV